MKLVHEQVYFDLWKYSFDKKVNSVSGGVVREIDIKLNKLVILIYLRDIIRR